MIQLEQPRTAASSRSGVPFSQQEDSFWQQANVEEKIRAILSEFASELKQMKRQREC